MNHLTTPQLEPMPLREAMENLEFITSAQLREANNAMSSLAAEVDMLRRENGMLRTERNFLQAYAAEVNASIDIMTQIMDRIRSQAKQFAIDTTKAETKAAPPAEIQLDAADEAELRRVMSRIPPGPVEKMEDRQPVRRVPRHDDPRMPAQQPYSPTMEARHGR